MKKYLVLLLFVLSTGLVFVSCSDSEDNPTGGGGTTSKASVVIISTPAGAQIWQNGTNTNKVTPDSITGLDAGSYTFILKKTDYVDDTLSVTVTAGQKSTQTATLKSQQVAFGPIQIWETTGTTAQQPSGLVLATGTASGIGSSATDRAKVDIYYSSNGFVVTSADQATGLTRKTYFKVGGGSNLNDGNDPAGPKDNSWTNQMGDREPNYVYLYDNDQHYSKVKIVDHGGGTPGDPAWVKIQGIYNKAQNSFNF